MSEIAIKVDELSKIYHLGEISTGTVSRDIERWFRTNILKQEDPFLKIGETNDRTTRGKSEFVYSLKDINFEIKQGDAVGIVGLNGAGKSTLLKIISRVTTPTTGRIKIKGRIASLLEVGTGFHPELTGRENIFLNGAILGMRKKEIVRNLDEIIDFSGVERYIDTPVKRYSSGMYVRLAFAVAAHLESEILIVDEVLAVGDAEFQSKCLGKMGEISKGEGRTVLFVSHNLSAVSQFCGKGIMLENGKMSGGLDDIGNIIQRYQSRGVESSNYSSSWRGELGNEDIQILETSVSSEGKFATSIDTADDIIVCVKFIPQKQKRGLIFGFLLVSEFNNPLAYCLYDDALNNNINFVFGIVNVVEFRIPKFTLAEGSYFIQFDFGIHMRGRFVGIDCDLNFEVTNQVGYGGKWVVNKRVPYRYSLFRPNWQINHLLE